MVTWPLSEKALLDCNGIVEVHCQVSLGYHLYMCVKVCIEVERAQFNCVTAIASSLINNILLFFSALFYTYLLYHVCRDAPKPCGAGEYSLGRAVKCLDCPAGHSCPTNDVSVLYKHWALLLSMLPACLVAFDHAFLNLI